MRMRWGFAAVALLSVALGAQPTGGALKLDAAGEKWIRASLASMSLDDKVGQMLVSSFGSDFLPTDTDAFDTLAKTVREQHIGGFHVFGGSEPVPEVLLDSHYGTVTLGQPLAAASLLNRLQAISRYPLLNSADFETGLGFRLEGATTFPRNMAFGAAGDDQLAYQAGRITAEEARAIGVQLNFAPVVDVNNNPRNPVINTRSYGEDPEAVGRLAAAYVRGLQEGGMLATLKHFPGHGDTDVDSHLGLPIIKDPLETLEHVELPPFKAGIAAGAEAVMTAHIEMPALDPTPNTPTTLSRPIVSGVLRKDLSFGGLIVTDSMQMAGVAALYSPGEAAVRAVKAGNDLILHSADNAAAFEAIKAAVASGDIPMAQIDASVTRILRAKAMTGLNRVRGVNLDQVPNVIGGRAHQAVADEVSQRSITLIKDERGDVPLKLPREAHVLYLSVLDFPSGWRIAAPSRTFIPELKKHWPNVTSIELSERSTANEIALVRAMAPRFDAVIASVFVRAASGSGRMDLPANMQALLRTIARDSAASRTPFVTVLFGNPYTAAFLQDLPAMLLTYDFYDRPERSAVRAIAGEAPIGGKLPIGIPGVAPRGTGLQRAAASPSAAGR
ncbi:MAG TPA: glycoside hydrolase family 3 protein [Vicinamibacterales bacterium]|jgi:beta-N-acetylhexosaminidase|nr:glycoside hydrolase family 3 protein [Vicinamibacterales bacterium]